MPPNPEVEKRIKLERKRIKQMLRGIKNPVSEDKKIQLLKKLHSPDLPSRLASYVFNMAYSKRKLASIAHKNSDLGREIQEIVNHYPVSNLNNWIYKRPSRNDYDIFKTINTKYTNQHIINVVKSIKTNSTVTPDEVKILLEKVVTAIIDTHPQLNGWKFDFQFGDQFKFYGFQKKIMIQNKSISSKRLQRIIYHEIFTHLLRYINAKNNSIIKRLPGYRNFEEGLAIVTEQVCCNNAVIRRKSRLLPLLITLSAAGLVDTKMDECIDTLIVSKRHRLELKKLFNKNKLSNLHSISQNHYYQSYQPLAYTIGLMEVNYLLNTLNDDLQSTILRKAIYIIIENIYEAKFNPLYRDHIDYLIVQNIIQLSALEYDEYMNFLSSEKTIYILSMSKNINQR